MKNTDKITMTVGQLKKLVKESRYSNEYIWQIKRLMGDYAIETNVVKESDVIFDSYQEALDDGMIQLEKYKKAGKYKLEILIDDDPPSCVAYVFNNNGYIHGPYKTKFIR